MPKLAPRFFQIRPTERAEQVGFRVECSVSSKGVFRLKVPADIQDAVKQLFNGRQPVAGLPECWWNCVTLSGDTVEGKVADQCETVIRRAAKIHLAAKVEVELVILYRCNIRASFTIDQHGGVHPDGSRVKSEWWKPSAQGACTAGETGFREDQTYVVGFSACAMWKTTVAREGGKSVTFRRAREADHLDPKDWKPSPPAAVALNEFIGLRWPDNLREYRMEDVQEIPYTDEAAIGLREAILGLCRLALGIDRFFANPEAVRQIGTSGSLLLPPPTK